MSSTRTPTSWGHVAGAVLGLTALLALVLTAFAWPAARSAPRDVPIAVAAPAPVAAQVERGLTTAAGAFDVRRVGSRAAAVSAIEDREVYGALVVGPSGPRMLTASAAGPAVAQILGQVAARMSAESPAGPVEVIDVVPLPEDDPRGAGLAAGALPLVLAGIAAAAVLSLRMSGPWRRLVGAVGFAVGGGLAVTAILQFWLGSLAGDYWLTSAVVSLAVGAVATTLLGLERVLGPAGLGVGAAVMLLLGNPLSGLTSAPELLPSGWGALGQLLPPGAAGTALRSVAFFDGAGAGEALVVLGCWLAAGLLLCAVPVSRARRLRVAEPVAA
ncbi:MAG: hypothetical protein M3165_02305 [Actinomycetota bacterium]|nr:hypothetical protein [Actinomycetota bacterium]